jgi:hypothetical protein
MRENETILDATEVTGHSLRSANSDAMNHHPMGSVAAQSVGSVRLVDIPGHPRLRKLIRAFAGRARNVTFVIDSKSFSATSKENAECALPPLVCVVINNGASDLSLLLNILDESEFRKRKMLIACNKVCSTVHVMVAPFEHPRRDHFGCNW